MTAQWKHGVKLSPSLKEELDSAIASFRRDGGLAQAQRLAHDRTMEDEVAEACFSHVIDAIQSPADLLQMRPLVLAWIESMRPQQERLDRALAGLAMTDTPVALEVVAALRDAGASTRHLFSGTAALVVVREINGGDERVDRMLAAALPLKITESPVLEVPAMGRQPPYRKPLLRLLAACKSTIPERTDACVAAGRLIMERSTPAALEDAQFVLRVELRPADAHHPCVDLSAVGHLLRMGVPLGRLERELTQDLHAQSKDSAAPRRTIAAWMAAMEGGLEALQALANAGLPLDLPNGDVHGHRPLHFAVAAQSLEAVKVLLAAGADPVGAPAGNGNHALDEALRRRELAVASAPPTIIREHDEIVDCLRAAAARCAAQRAITTAEQPLAEAGATP